MKSEEYQYVFFIFGFTAIFYALNNLLTSIVKGFKEYKLYVKISIANTLFGLVFTVTLVTSLGLKGALIGAVTFQSVMIFITLWLLRKAHWLKWENFKSRCKRYAVNRYFRYSLMALTSAAVVPVSQIFLRGYVISEISAVEAGWWEAMNRVSSTYLSIITSSFGVYYLPKLSETKDNLSLHHEIMKAYKVIVPVLIVGLILVYMFRRLVITILFSPAFYPMENLFIWQEIGDFFKIMSWLLAYLMLAKAKTILFISSEILSSLLFVLLGLFFIHFYGVIGLTQAYMGHYLIYFIVMVIAFRNIIFVKFRKRDYDC
jgi:PST family polysaccharide transporter